MLEKKTLDKSTQVELATPDSGFSQDFIDMLSGICSKYENLLESYLVLKKQGEEVSLLFGLLFVDSSLLEEQELTVQNIMTEILDLFSDEMTIETICLNNNDQLKQAMESMTSPFYSK